MLFAYHVYSVASRLFHWRLHTDSSGIWHALWLLLGCRRLSWSYIRWILARCKCCIFFWLRIHYFHDLCLSLARLIVYPDCWGPVWWYPFQLFSEGRCDVFAGKIILCDPHLSALEVRFSWWGTIQIYNLHLLLPFPGGKIVCFVYVWCNTDCLYGYWTAQWLCF